MALTAVFTPVYSKTKILHGPDKACLFLDLCSKSAQRHGNLLLSIQKLFYEVVTSSDSTFRHEMILEES